MNKENAKDQIKSFSVLQENWDSYGAESFKEKTIERSIRVIEILKDEFEDPFIAPSCAGIQFEWRRGDDAVEIFIDEDVDSIGYLKVNGKYSIDWSEGEFQNYDNINRLLEWLFKKESNGDKEC